jgi:hypothetical protein
MTTRPTQCDGGFSFSGNPREIDAVIAAIEACTNMKYEAIVGKPSIFMTNAILNLLAKNAHEQFPPERCTMTGATTLSDAQSSNIKPTYLINDLGGFAA